MDERSHTPHDGLARVQDLLAGLVEALATALLALPLPAARWLDRPDRTLRSA